MSDPKTPTETPQRDSGDETAKPVIPPSDFVEDPADDEDDEDQYDESEEEE